MVSTVYSVGVDLGGTKIAGALVNKEGHVENLLKLGTDAEAGPSAVKDQIVAVVRELIKNTDVSPVGVGIGLAGQIDPKSGRVVFAPNLDWHDVDLKADLNDELQLPVAVTNDVRAITWGEWLFGSGKGCRDLICMYVGTGVGGGVVSGGRMLDGCNNTAGEIGHITIHMHGPRCHCGGRGCLEAFAGGWAIGERAQEVVSAHPAQKTMLLSLAGGQLGNITAETVSQAFHRGDLLACRLVDEAAKALTAGAVTLIHAFNPCLFILGGGVIDGLPELIEQVDHGVRARCLPSAIESLEVVAAKLGDKAGVVGAAALAMQLFSE